MGNGEKIMKNLEAANVLVDYGTIEMELVEKVEKLNGIKLPNEYKQFIIRHNGASLIIHSFDFYDENIGDESSDAITFIEVQEITMFMDGLLRESMDDPDYFPEKLIPFGDTGGGDFICFDYRDYNGSNPPIIIWNHDVYENSKRISFIANNFEEFINMLHEYRE